jgi:hypothetical protein
MVPMPVSLTDPNSDAAGDFRDDHWFVADIQRTGKCRYRQERNKKKGKNSILQGFSSGGTLAVPMLAQIESKAPQSRPKEP